MNLDGSAQLANEDLASFSEKIEHVRILALGEQTHGAARIFTLKTDLIKYLHQHHAFNFLFYKVVCTM